MKVEKDNLRPRARLEGGELKPCPFCGSTNLELLNTWTAVYWVECKCGVEVTGRAYPDPDSLEDHELAAKSAIERWNRRVYPEKLQ